MPNEKNKSPNKYWEAMEGGLVLFEGEVKRLCKNFYEVLEVSSDATQEEIKNAFRRLAMKWHPDKWSGSPEEKQKQAEENFKLVYNAYSILGNSKTRQAYDKKESGMEFCDEGEDFDDEVYAREAQEIQAEIERLRVQREGLTRHRFFSRIATWFLSCSRDGKVEDEDLDPNLWAPYENWQEKVLKMDFDERKLMKFSREMSEAIIKVSHEKMLAKRKTIRVNIVSNPSDFKNRASNSRVIGKSSHSQVVNSQTTNNYGETRGETFSSGSNESLFERFKKNAVETTEKVKEGFVKAGESLTTQIQALLNQN